MSEQSAEQAHVVAHEHGQELVCSCGEHLSVYGLTRTLHSVWAQHVRTARILSEAAGRSPVIDASHIERQRAWSTATFGPREQRGPTGPLAHIRKEVEEVAEDPTVLEEWVDVIILAFDGAWRAGHEPQQIVDAVKAKQTKNEARTWPDWRGVPDDEAIEHVSCGFHAWGPDDRCVTCDESRTPPGQRTEADQ